MRGIGFAEQLSRFLRVVGLFREIDRFQEFVDEADWKPDRDYDEGCQGRADESSPGFRARFAVGHFLGDFRPDVFPEGHSS